MSGEKWSRFNESSRRVYDPEGIAPTIPTVAGGGHMPKVIVHNLQQRNENRPSLTRICDCGSGKLYRKCHGVDGGSGHISRDDGNTYCLDSSRQGVEVPPSRIRKLTPLECERLQGFPDGWTEGLSDTQRYKTMGNAVTVNVVRDICSRLLN